MNLKVVSINVWLGGILMDDIITFLRNQDADIVMLQEAFNGTNLELEHRFRTMQALQEALGYANSHFAPAYRDFDFTNGGAERGNGILSKFPIIGGDNIFLSGEYSVTYRDEPGKYQTCPRNLQHAVLRTPVGELNAFNIQGVWDIDGDNYSKDRKHMAHTILSSVKDKPNVIVAGDTNAKMTNQAIMDIETELVNVFGRELTSTFNMRRKDNPGYATAAVDTIFVSRGITVLDKQCPDVDVSDHLPITALIELEA